MSIAQFTESEVESAARAWLESLGWTIKYGPDISPGGDTLTLALCQMEPESYRVYLAEFDEEADGAESGMTADGEARVSA